MPNEKTLRAICLSSVCSVHLELTLYTLWSFMMKMYMVLSPCRGLSKTPNFLSGSCFFNDSPLMTLFPRWNYQLSSHISLNCSLKLKVSPNAGHWASSLPSRTQTQVPAKGETWYHGTGGWWAPCFDPIRHLFMIYSSRWQMRMNNNSNFSVRKYF